MVHTTGNNRLSGTLIPGVSILNSLPSIWLMQGSISGPIPPEYGDLKHLVALSLHDNSITGSIPEEIYNLNSLAFLALSGNQITGSISPSIGNLQSLIHVWINNNLLSNDILSEMGSLKNLGEYLLAFILSGTVHLIQHLILLQPCRSTTPTYNRRAVANTQWFFWRNSWRSVCPMRWHHSTRCPFGSLGRLCWYWSEGCLPLLRCMLVDWKDRVLIESSLVKVSFIEISLNYMQAVDELKHVVLRLDIVMLCVVVELRFLSKLPYYWH